MFHGGDKIGYKCYGCGVGGNASILAKDLNRDDVSRMIDDMTGYVRYEQEEGKPSINPNVFNMGIKFTDNNGEKKAPTHFATKEQMLQWERNEPKYFLSRGIPLETCRHLGMGEDYEGYQYPSMNVTNSDGSPKLINMGPRGVFVVRNMKGEIVGWSGRLTYNNNDNFPPRYFHQVDRNEYLWNENNLDLTLNYVVVFEGQMGGANFAKFGVKNCVATMGANLSDVQFRRLDSLFEWVIFVPDMDVAGQRFAGEIRQAFGNKAIINPFDFRNTDGSMKDSGDFVRNEVGFYLSEVKKIMNSIRP